MIQAILLVARCLTGYPKIAHIWATIWVEISQKFGGFPFLVGKTSNVVFLTFLRLLNLNLKSVWP